MKKETNETKSNTNSNHRHYDNTVHMRTDSPCNTAGANGRDLRLALQCSAVKEPGDGARHQFRRRRRRWAAETFPPLRQCSRAECHTSAGEGIHFGNHADSHRRARPVCGRGWQPHGHEHLRQLYYPGDRRYPSLCRWQDSRRHRHRVGAKEHDMEIADYVVAAFNKMTESCAGQWPRI